MKCTLASLLAGISLAALPIVQAEFGDIVWEFEATSDTQSISSPAIDSLGNVYFGSRDGKLYSVDSSGNARWSFSVGDWVDSSPVLNHSQSVVYVGSWDNSLYAIDTATGVLKWSFETGNLIFSSPAVANDGTVYLGSGDGFLYALVDNGTSVSVKWEAFFGGEIDSSPSIDTSGNIYVGTIAGEVVALSPDGSTRWTFAADEIADRENGIVSSALVTDSGVVYVGSHNYYLYALDADNGNELWRFEAFDKIETSPALGMDGNIVFGSHDGFVYSVDSDAGIMQWQSFVGDIFLSSPTIDLLGRIYIGAYLGQGISALVALSPSGSILWGTTFDDFVDASTAISPDGTAYVTTYNGSLYAIEAGAALANSQWPRFGRNNEGRSSLEGYWSPSPNGERLINLSSRGVVGSGDQVMIAGFVYSHSNSKRILARSVGPSLKSVFGLEGELIDPLIELHEIVGTESALIADNDDWLDSPDSEAEKAIWNQVGAFSLDEPSLDSSLSVDIDNGIYSAIAKGVAGQTGIALVELYDADESDSGTSLANASIRGSVGVGAERLIAGFVIQGNFPRKILIRSVGKSLEPLGVADFVPDPQLELYRGSDLVDTNDNWDESLDRIALEAAFAESGAFALEEGSLDSALIVILPAGIYSAHSISVTGVVGTGLLELYDLGEPE